MDHRSRATGQANSYQRQIDDRWETMVETETPGWFVNERFLIGRQRSRANPTAAVNDLGR